MRSMLAFAAAAALAAVPHASAGEVEVLHWWTSGGEARSVQSLKDMLAGQGHQWRDFAVAGGAGGEAMAALRSRVLAGRAPAAAQINGTALQEWGRMKVLANLDDVAREQQWDVRLVPLIAQAMKVDGHYVAAPVNVHRINWLWINRALLDRVGGRTPQTWDQFFALADRLQKAGFIALAHGGQPWQDFTTFETVALGVGGAEFYRRALVRLEPAALKSDTMARVLATFRRLKAYTDAKAPGRDWSAATGMVVRGEAGMQLMGDWAKGEFIAAGKQPVRDFICASAPGSDRAYSFTVDSFAMFRLNDAVAVQAQTALARTIMDPRFQETFNLNKGSIPAGLGVEMGRFDHCAQESSAYFVASSMIGTLVPSVAHKMALPERTAARLRDVVSRFWNHDATSVDDTMAALLHAARE
ncbi:ABC transporter substrate-binding protein [Aquabacterium humicola]|uniref:ABC transporter substrate-binding protein n=1 Tax=Aquabacterium humicola TaxID=3237377 RepID=UPI0025427909|nr:ABC transporter substrate-binding protein [Rubrivivax pictus]